MKYFIYCRKSTEGEERQALSLPAQVRELQEYAKSNNLEVVKTYSEAKSGKTPNKREQFNEMIERIKKGDADAILCWHTSRLSRNPLESGIIQQMITDEELLEIRTPIDLISSFNANDILLGVQFGNNSQYSKDLSRNTKRGIREKIYRGQYPSVAPAFYLNFGATKDDKNIIPDPKNFKFYEKLVDEVISKKLSLSECRQQLITWGVRNKKGGLFHKSAIAHILRNPCYYGLIRRTGYDEAMGKWQPLITKEKWLLLQSVLDGKSTPYYARVKHQFKGVMKCGRCGLSITAYTKVKKSGKKYIYYCCTKKKGDCGNSLTREEIIESQILKAIDSIAISKEFSVRLKKLTEEKLNAEHKHEIKTKENIELELKRHSAELDQLLQMRLSDEISKSEYLDNKGKINIKIENLEELRSDVKFSREDLRKKLELFFDTSFNIKKVFTNGSFEDKQKLLKAITEEILLDNGKISLNLKKPWDTMVLIKTAPNSTEMLRVKGSNLQPWS